MTPRIVRAMVVLTALLCLGVAGHAGQVWWAQRIGTQMALLLGPGVSSQGSYLTPDLLLLCWTDSAWYGAFGLPRGGTIGVLPTWIPKRAWRELLKQLAGVDLGNDPTAWEAWFKAHPNLVWDDKLNRLVEKP